jgi:hypothetical protein
LHAWDHLEECGWPGPANTGPDLSQCPGHVLTSEPGEPQRVIVVDLPNVVITCREMAGQLEIAAQNVVISNSRISADGNGRGGRGVITIDDGASATIDHVDLNGLNHTHACVFNVGTKSARLHYSLLASHINCHGVNDGIFSWWWPRNKNDGAGSDFMIVDSYFHDFTENAANGHIDGYQTEGAENGLILHNTFLINRAEHDVDVPGAGVNSAIAIWDDYMEPRPTGRNAGDITVVSNLIAGGGFSIYAEDRSGDSGGAENVPNSAVGGNNLINVIFLDNYFSTYLNPCVGKYGVWFYRRRWPPYYGGPTDLWNQGGSVRSGNVVLETGENIDTGGPAGCEGHETSQPAARWEIK